MRALIPALALLAGCGGDKSENGIFAEDLACSGNPYDWFDTVVGSLMRADDSGAFDYDPPGSTVDRREGSYDLESGDFSWTNTYADGYTVVDGGSEGYGTVFPDGDADLLYKSVATDILGEQGASRIRTEREGCEGTYKTWDIDPDDDLDTEPSDDPVVWEYTIESSDKVVMQTPDDFEVDGEPYASTRTMTSDLDVVSEGDWADGYQVWTATSHGDGTWEQDIQIYETEYDGYYAYDGEFDGSRAVSIDIYEPGGGDLMQSCAYQVDYAGAGGGECGFMLSDGSWVECDVEFGADGSCMLDCGSLGTQDCS